MNSRKHFEVWIKPLWHLETFEANDNCLQYRDEIIQGKWEAWQAASKASEQQLEESRREFRAADATIHNLELKVAQVVAERDVITADNAYLRGEVICWARECDRITHTYTNKITDAHQLDAERELANTLPATDAYLAEVRAQARNEGINYAASRLAAAFNHGFVDKPLAEVYDVVRMILTAKEDLVNDPAADGLSGEYAEKSLVEFAAQLRQGAEHE